MLLYSAPSKTHEDKYYTKDSCRQYESARRDERVSGYILCIMGTPPPCLARSGIRRSQDKNMIPATTATFIVSVTALQSVLASFFPTQKLLIVPRDTAVPAQTRKGALTVAQSNARDQGYSCYSSCRTCIVLQDEPTYQ